MSRRATHSASVVHCVGCGADRTIPLHAGMRAIAAYTHTLEIPEIRYFMASRLHRKLLRINNGAVHAHKAIEAAVKEMAGLKASVT